jgi:hypothetical protein
MWQRGSEPSFRQWLCSHAACPPLSSRLAALASYRAVLATTLLTHHCHGAHAGQHLPRLVREEGLCPIPEPKSTDASTQKRQKEAVFCSLPQHERGPREHRRRSAPLSQRNHAKQEVSAPLSFPRSLSRAATCRYVASKLALLQQPWSNHTCERTHPSTLAWVSSGEAPHPPSALGVVLGPCKPK